MCGIVGIVSRAGLNPAVVTAMVETLRHRGPDDGGIWVSDDHTVALAHRRLSILDLSPLGRNPMSWDNGRLQITYNGEIYNHQDLRSELQAIGYRFRSHTDTEVILAAYDRWGIDCLHRFIGMFAFGLWDAPHKQLFLARDRLGQKPLYYSEHDGEIEFASELKALLAQDDFPREVNREALSMYMRYGYVPAPFTIFRRASKLPPAHYALWKNGALTIVSYWNPLAIALRGATALDEADATQRFEELVRDSVRRQMIADVPVGAFLSGGMDSSLISAIMQEESSKRIQSFTIRFENSAFNEADHAFSVARHLGTDHHEEICGINEMVEIAGRLHDYFDEPFADPSAIPTYLVARTARRKAIVALAGDGGDELFFGYERYHNFATRWLKMAAPQGGGCTAETLLDPEIQRYAHWHMSWQESQIEEMLRGPAIRSPAHQSMRRLLQRFVPLERAPLLDLLTYLPDQILTKVDRASMAVGLEARAPFLDHRVIEFALALPLEFKWRQGQGKWLLRRLLYSKVPRALVDRPKMGFSVPLVDLFHAGLGERISSAFAGSMLEELGIRPKPARALWQEFCAGNPQRVDMIWSLFALISWSGRWMHSHERALA